LYLFYLILRNFFLDYPIDIKTQIKIKSNYIGELH